MVTDISPEVSRLVKGEEMEDLEIVELYWNRDEQALKETSLKYGHYCYSIAYSILTSNEDAQECVNDTWLGAWNAMPPHHPTVLSTFLGKICRRLSLNKWRSMKAEKRGGKEVALSYDELEECIADTDSVKEDTDVQYLSEKINSFLETLKESDRKIFVCRYWYFESVNEIAARFQYTPSRVKMSLKRSRDRLREYLKKEGITV